MKVAFLGTLGKLDRSGREQGFYLSQRSQRPLRLSRSGEGPLLLNVAHRLLPGKMPKAETLV
jgi:hypothetical protein